MINYIACIMNIIQTTHGIKLFGFILQWLHKQESVTAFFIIRITRSKKYSRNFACEFEDNTCLACASHSVPTNTPWFRASAQQEAGLLHTWLKFFIGSSVCRVDETVSMIFVPKCFGSASAGDSPVEWVPRFERGSGRASAMIPSLFEYGNGSRESYITKLYSFRVSRAGNVSWQLSKVEWGSRIAENVLAAPSQSSSSLPARQLHATVLCSSGDPTRAVTFWASSVDELPENTLAVTKPFQQQELPRDVARGLSPLPGFGCQVARYLSYSADVSAFQRILGIRATRFKPRLFLRIPPPLTPSVFK